MYSSHSATNCGASPRIAIGIVPLAAELLEPFQWLTEEQSRHLDSEQSDAVREEMADVLLYLIRLADKLDVDLVAAARDRIVRNAAKYPVATAEGSRRKYTDL